MIMVTVELLLKRSFKNVNDFVDRTPIERSTLMVSALLFCTQYVKTKMFLCADITVDLFTETDSK